MLSVETSRWAEFFDGRLTNTVFPKQITVAEEGIRTVKVRSLLVPDAGGGSDAVWEDCLGSPSQGYHLGYAGI